MKKILVWDLPLRIFHWVFALCISGALLIALTAEDDTPVFKLHMLLGLSAGTLLLIRIIIGLFGGRYSRFRGLFFSPVETINYFFNAFTGKAKNYIGHNPGTSAAAIGMFVILGGLILTGLNMNTETAEEVHPVLAYLMIALIAAHLLGLVIHTIMYRENISLSIISGKKNGTENAAIKSAQPAAGLITLAAIAGWFILLFSSYQPESSSIRIPFTSTSVILGEEEKTMETDHEENDNHKDED